MTLLLRSGKELAYELDRKSFDVEKLATSDAPINQAETN